MPRCETIVVHRLRGSTGSHSLCAPSLFVAGVGKCGTNALAEHLAHHPSVRSMSRELAWDPKDTPPTALVRAKMVFPNESKVWIAKHPKYATYDVSSLASRLRSAYPKARVALALCNPALLPWRRFLFLLTSALTRHGTSTGQGNIFRQLSDELHALNSSLSHLYAATFNPSAHCLQTDQTRRLLETLAIRGFGVKYGNGWLRPGPLGEAHCHQEWRLATSYAEQVGAWVAALGAINKSVSVVYMEGWAEHGAEYMRSLLRILDLPEVVYPWSAVNFAQPVFANVKARSSVAAASMEHQSPLSATSAASSDSTAALLESLPRLAAFTSGLHTTSPSLIPGPPTPPPTPTWLRPGAMTECVLQCKPLERLTGMHPPWCHTASRSRGARWYGIYQEDSEGERARCAPFRPPAASKAAHQSSVTH